MAGINVQYFKLRPSKTSLDVFHIAQDRVEGSVASGMAETLDGRNLGPLIIVWTFDTH